MADGMQVSARSVANMLARVFGPSFYDALYPHFDRGNLDRHKLFDLVGGPRPEPWHVVMLNPQPLPPKELYALALADAHIHELLALDRAGEMLGGGSRSARWIGGCASWPRSRSYVHRCGRGRPRVGHRHYDHLGKMSR